MAEAVLVSACRTPIGRFQGKFASLRAPQLGAIAIAEAVTRAGIASADVEEVIFGNVLQAGLGQNPARQAAIAAGIPVTVGSLTINKVCGSGLKAVALAAQAIRAGDAHVIVAGGQESMTNSPYLMPGVRDGLRLGHGKLLDSMVHDGLWDIYNDFHMGVTGDLVAERCAVTREEQDRFAAESHRRAAAAQASGAFKKEIVDVKIPGRKGEVTVVSVDEGVRADSTADALGKMKAAFSPTGTVTAGNASQISDGASATVITTAEVAERLGVTPLAEIIAYGQVAGPDASLLHQPSRAIKAALDRAGMSVGDIGLFEINEAFAAVGVASADDLGVSMDIVNVNGGAIAIGHPLGMSGNRITLHLALELARRGGGTGAAALCGGGGQGDAIIIRTMA